MNGLCVFSIITVFGFTVVMLVSLRSKLRFVCRCVVENLLGSTHLSAFAGGYGSTRRADMPSMVRSATHPVLSSFLSSEPSSWLQLRTDVRALASQSSPSTLVRCSDLLCSRGVSPPARNTLRSVMSSLCSSEQLREKYGLAPIRLKVPQFWHVFEIISHDIYGDNRRCILITK